MISPFIWTYDLATCFFSNSRFISLLMPFFYLAAVVICIYIIREVIYVRRS